MSGLKLADALDDALCGRRRETGEKAAHGPPVHTALDLRRLQDPLHLRGEEEPSAYFGIIQRLDPQSVPSQQQSLRAVVPEREGEHPAQFLDTVLSVLLVEMDDHLRIGGGRKRMAALLKFPAEVAKVVDLTVKHHPDRGVLVVDRLASGLQVDDAQAAHTQAHALVPSEIEPLIVGAPMDERRAHRAQLFQRDRLPLETHYSRNAAHCP